MKMNNFPLKFLTEFVDKFSLYYSILSLILCVLLVFWLIHVIYSITSYIRRWLHLKHCTVRLESSNVMDNKFYFYKEAIIRYVVFFILLLFEIGYFLEYSLNDLILNIFQVPGSDINIGNNCTILNNTVISSFFDTRPIKLIETFLSSHTRSLLISSTWMYAILMLHLAYAAKDELLSLKKLAKLIIFGFVQHVVILVFSWIPWTKLIALLLEPLISQFNFIVAVVLARRFLKAMESRVNMAYHTRDVSYEKQQRLLLKQYRIIIPFTLWIIELHCLKVIILYNPYFVAETILLNPCIYHLPKVNLSENTMRYYLTIYEVLAFLFIRIINTICSFGLIALNFAVICKWAKSKCKRVRYRYHVSDVLAYPLLK